MMRILALLLLVMPLVEGREIVFYLLNPLKDCPREIYLVGPKMSLPVDLPTRNFSEDYDLPPGDLTLALMRKPLEEGEIVPASAPKITLPMTMKRAAVILVPSTKNAKMPVRPILVDLSSMKNGSAIFYNFSNNRVFGELGGEKMHISPRGTYTMNTSKMSGATFPVEISCLKPGAQDPVPMISAYWKSYPKHRQFTFIVDVPNRPAPVVKTVLEFEAPPTEE